MFYKNREESKELRSLHLLNARMDLQQNEKQHYLNLKKGYEGEVQFDQYTEGAGLDKKFYILNDLLLKYDNTIFQIDSTIITQHWILPCEIKNFDRNYYYHGDKNFYSCSSKNIIKNPLDQLNRIKIMLQKLLQKNGFNIPVEGHLIFINPEFYLYQAPMNEPTVFHPQLKKFLTELDSKPANLNSNHWNLADFLLEEHIADSPYMQLPSYKYQSLRKRIICNNCCSTSLEVDGRKIVCLQCGEQEKIEFAVVRCVEELKLLFPEVKITANIVLDWCMLSISMKWLRKILKKHYVAVGVGKGTYYV